jgi:hypothetical protein
MHAYPAPPIQELHGGKRRPVDEHNRTKEIHMHKKRTTLLIGGLLLVFLLAACAGGNPPATTSPVDSKDLPAAYPEPGGAYPYPAGDQASPPADQAVVSPPSSEPLQPYPEPWQPQTADDNLQRGEAFVSQVDILVAESFPPQYRLIIKGTLPTPCHQLRVEVAPPDSQDIIQVSVYSVVDPDAICTQVLAPFETTVPLQGLPSGTYTVVVNGEEAGSIEVP